MKNEMNNKAHGSGYVMIYKFDEEFVKNETFLQEHMKECFVGGLGAIFFINFEKSKVGPFQQIVFFPGRFDAGVEKYYSVSKAYVSTPEAVEYCRTELEIPAELAAFEQKKISDDIEHISISNNSGKIISFEMEEWGLKFSLNSNLVDFPIMQKNSNLQKRMFEYLGKGEAKFATLNSVEIRPALFPDFAKFSSLATVKLEDFSLLIKENKTY